MSTALPDFETGVNYWANTEASVNGVLGGYGEGTPVPRLDATSSRLLILSLMPHLSTIPPPHHPSSSSSSTTSPRRLEAAARPFRALDCGAGIGRVTSTVLLPLFDSVELVEPVPAFVEQAKKDALEGRQGWKYLHQQSQQQQRQRQPRQANGRTDEPARGTDDDDALGQRAGEERTKAVRIWRAGLQHFDPARPAVAVSSRASSSSTGTVELYATIGANPSCAFADPATPLDPTEQGYDLVMIQWCIGHLSDDELAEFLRRSHAALKRSKDGTVEGFIIVKENVCKDTEKDGRLFDDEDSSITRSDAAFRNVFKMANLTLLRREVQQGFPKELFPVVAYALQ
ncbi:hypothetical protein JCM10212_001451 [Sporobolomyces blumeae]